MANVEQSSRLGLGQARFRLSLHRIVSAGFALRGVLGFHGVGLQGGPQDARGHPSVARPRESGASGRPRCPPGPASISRGCPTSDSGGGRGRKEGAMAMDRDTGPSADAEAEAERGVRLRTRVVIQRPRARLGDWLHTGSATIMARDANHHRHSSAH